MNVNQLEYELTSGIARPLAKIFEDQNKIVQKISSIAPNSALYRKKLEKCPIKTIEDLQHFPITTYADINETINNYGLESVLTCPSVKWWQTTGTTGKPKKFYNSESDIEAISLSCARTFLLNGTQPKDIILNAGAGEPWVSSTFVHLGSEKAGLTEIQIPIFNELDIVNLLAKAIDYGKINIVAGVPLVSVVLKYAVFDPDYLRENVRAKLGTKFSEVEPLFEKIKPENLREIFSYTKLGFFGGQPPKLFKNELSDIFPNARFIDAYGACEFGIGAAEIREGAGLRPNLDLVIMELVPLLEMKKWSQDKSYVPKAIHAKDWYRGLVGELLVTPLTLCMPKIRLTPGDIIEVIDPARTDYVQLSSGRIKIKLPVIKVLGRSSETIIVEPEKENAALGAAYLFRSQITDALLNVYSKIRWWDLYVNKDNLKLEIVPEQEATNKEEFKMDIREKLLRESKSLRGVANENPSYLTIKILGPESYIKVEQEIQRRKEQGKPLGQLKPEQIHFL